MTGLALGAASDADGLGYVALNDLAPEDVVADYRVIGGHMLTMLTNRSTRAECREGYTAADLEPVSGFESLTCRLQEVRPRAPSDTTNRSTARRRRFRRETFDRCDHRSSGL